MVSCFLVFESWVTSCLW